MSGGAFLNGFTGNVQGSLNRKKPRLRGLGAYSLRLSGQHIEMGWWVMFQQHPLSAIWWQGATPAPDASRSYRAGSSRPMPTGFHQSLHGLAKRVCFPRRTKFFRASSSIVSRPGICVLPAKMASRR